MHDVTMKIKNIMKFETKPAITLSVERLSSSQEGAVPFSLFLIHCSQI